MQLTGDRFTQEQRCSATISRPSRTFRPRSAPPPELLPASSFQLHFADHGILTPGDRPDVLVAMNPAALKANLSDVPKGASLIIDTHDFTERALARIGWTSNPLDDGTLEGYHVHALDLTELTLEALKELELSRKDAGRSKTVFALDRCRGCIRDRRRERSNSSRRNSRTNRTSPPPTPLLSRRATTSARRPRHSPSRLDQARGAAERQVPQHHRQPGAVVRADRGVAAQRTAAVPRRVPDHSGQRHLHELSNTSGSACGCSRPRTRSPVSARRSARPSAEARSDDLSAPASRSRARRSGWRYRSNCR